MASSKSELSYTYWHGKGGGDAPIVSPQVWRLCAAGFLPERAPSDTCGVTETRSRRRSFVGRAQGTGHERVECGASHVPVQCVHPGLSAPLRQAGTWEEKDWTGWAKSRLTELCCALAVPLPHGVGDLCVKKVTTCTGDATVVVVRGTPRTGFDLDVALSWACELGGDEERTVTGTACLPDASRSAVGAGETADDMSYIFSIDKKAKVKLAAVEETALKDGGMVLRQRLFDVLRQLDSEMQQRLADE